MPSLYLLTLVLISKRGETRRESETMQFIPFVLIYEVADNDRGSITMDAAVSNHRRPFTE